MTLIRFGAFEVDAQSGELRRDGKKVKIQEQPFQVLILLVERPGEVLTREELARRLWSEQTNVDFERGLNKAITRLREALRDSAENPRYVETLPRRGYRFIAHVTNGALGAEVETKSRENNNNRKQSDSLPAMLLTPLDDRRKRVPVAAVGLRFCCRRRPTARLCCCSPTRFLDLSHIGLYLIVDVRPLRPERGSEPVLVEVDHARARVEQRPAERRGRLRRVQARVRRRRVGVGGGEEEFIAKPSIFASQIAHRQFAVENAQAAARRHDGEEPGARGGGRAEG